MDPVLQFGRIHCLDHQENAAIRYCLPGWNTEETTQAPSPVVEQPGTVAKFVAIPRPYSRLVGIKILTGTRYGVFQHGERSKIAPHDGSFRIGQIVHAKFQQAVNLKESPGLHSDRCRPIGRVPAESADICLLGVCEGHQI